MLFSKVFFDMSIGFCSSVGHQINYYDLNHVIKYECHNEEKDNWFWVPNYEHRECGHGAVWSGQVPTCKKIEDTTTSTTTTTTTMTTTTTTITTTTTTITTTITKTTSYIKLNFKTLSLTKNNL